MLRDPAAILSLITEEDPGFQVTSPFDLKALCEVYDEESRPTFLSLFADLSDQNHAAELERRLGELKAAVDDELASHLDEAWNQAKQALAEQTAAKGTRGVVVFASPANEFLEAHGLADPIPTRLVLDSGPYIRPLARFADENESFALVLMDSENAAILAVTPTGAQEKAEASTNLIGRHRRGGMSQMRYQRHRQGQVDKFFDQVIEHLEGIVEEEKLARIVLAGPGTAKREFQGRLPKALADLVTAVEDADLRDNQDALVRRFAGLVRDEAATEAATWAKALRRELSTGELATTGALPCVTDAAAGRVERLVVLKGYTVPGAKCEEHQQAFARSASCHCGAEGTPVDLVNEAIEFTVRAGGQAEFVDPPEPFLEGVGGVGALLRW